ncbi:MAG: DUF3592 domain-containing protein [Ruminococcus sp.]|nr:DUF3592 domain-containing protein [Ruminococcus sp.]
MDSRNLKKPELLKGIIIGLFLVVISIIMFNVTTFNKTDYKKDGKKVQCTVYSYQHILKHYDIRVKYKDDSGEFVKAELIMGGFPPHLNQTLDGYVMPDNPHKVYQESNIVLIVLMYALILFFFGAGIFILWASFDSSANYRLLKASGKSCEGEIFEVTMEKDNKGKLFYPAKYSYTDDDGNSQTGTTVFERRPPDIGDKFMVIYARKRNGKYISEMIH